MDRVTFKNFLVEEKGMNEALADVWGNWMTLLVGHRLEEVQEKATKHFEYSEEEQRQKQDETEVESVLLVVDCVRNNSVDIRCGGPQFLGYDFNVEKEKVEEMKAFIQQKINENNQSFIGISEELFRKSKKCNIWTKTDIEIAICKSYEPSSLTKDFTVSIPNTMIVKEK